MTKPPALSLCLGDSFGFVLEKSCSLNANAVSCLSCLLFQINNVREANNATSKSPKFDVYL